MSAPEQPSRPSVAPRPMPPKVPGKFPAMPPPSQAPVSAPGQAAPTNPGLSTPASPRSLSIAPRPSFKLIIEDEPAIEVPIEPRRPLKATLERQMLGRPNLTFKTHVARDSNGVLLDLSKTFAELNVSEVSLVPGDEESLTEAATLYSLEPSPSPRPLTQSSSDPSVAAPKDGSEPPSPRTSAPRPAPRPVSVRATGSLPATNAAPVAPRPVVAPNLASNSEAPQRRVVSSEIASSTTASSPGTPKRTVIPPAHRAPPAASTSSASSGTLEERLIAAEERMANLEESMTQNSKLLEQIMALMQIKQ